MAQHDGRHEPSLAEMLRRPEFPRAASYDAEWMLQTAMGPNVLWLAEALGEVMELAPGMRILDLGCGRAASSIFLAREFGATVWAADLWISPTENWERILSAGIEDRVFPIAAEAHALPFADGYFDALVSLDAYHYFGTDELYLGYVARFVRPEGQLGIIVPGVLSELDGGVPPHILPYWQWEFVSLHSPEWWRGHWEMTGQVHVELADSLPDGWRQWLDWTDVCARFGIEQNREAARREAEMLRIDAGRTFGFTRLLARRP